MVTLLEWFGEEPIYYYLIAFGALATLLILAARPGPRLRERRSELTFLLVIGLTLFAFRWPVFIVPFQLGPDEASLTADALKITKDLAPWRNFDAGTSGPLNFHFLLSRALSRPQDFHSRNWAMITKANPKLMAALGSRFLLADKQLQDPLLTLRTQQTNGEGITVYVYEIAGANTGGLSPTHTVLSGNAAETIALMTSPTFAFNETAVVHEANLSGLTPAEAGAINFKKGGVRIRGRSHGPALLVLPIQFSNSLEIISTRTNSKRVPIKMLRVNLLETGVLFDGEIDIKIAHVFGPFRGVKGRLHDVEDCKRLGIRETGEIPYPPNYQPLAKFHPKVNSSPR